MGYCSGPTCTSFSTGLSTVDPQDRRIAVSKRIKEEFENGRDYYKLEGLPLREPAETVGEAIG